MKFIEVKSVEDHLKLIIPDNFFDGWIDIIINDNDFNDPIRNEQNDNTTKQSEGTNQPV